MAEMIGKRYQILKLIGQGGMADVFLAMDTILNREVAVKVLHGDLASDPSALERFRREAGASTSLSHPNIVDIYDVGDEGGRHYIVMEYVKGHTLKQLIQKRGPLPVRESVWLMKQLVAAVQEAHRNGIIHRDIKSQNVLIKADGTVKLSDFGIALANDAMQLTSKDAVLGSVHYLAPECAKGKGASVQSDIYSLGIVFFEVLSGDVPFKGDQPIKIAMQHIRDEIPSLCAKDPAIPQAVENIINKATAKDPAQRYKSAGEMLKDLEVCLDPSHARDQATRFVKPVKDTEEERPKKKKKQEEGRDGFYGFLIAAISVISVLLVLLILFISGVIGSKQKYVEVPDLFGLSVIEADDKLDELGLSVDYSNITREMTDDTEAGRIISYTPEMGTEVEKGSRINVVVSEGIYAVMEDYIGQNIEMVREKLAGSNIVIEEKALDEGGEPGIILTQEGIRPKEKYNPNIVNYMTLGYTDYPTILIPFGTLGRNVDTVTQELAGQGFRVTPVQVEKSSLSEKEIGYGAGNVIRILPEEGTSYRQEGEAAIVLYWFAEGE